MKLSIIIPTLNEQANIGKLLSRLDQINDSRLIEILVADGGSTDSTCHIAKEYPIKILNLSKKSRAYQMNQAAKIATGNTLYFIHADTEPPMTFVEDIHSSLQNGSQVGSYSFKLDSADPRLKLLSILTKLDWLICRGGDQTLFVTKEFFETMGGFDEKFVIMEDFAFIRKARRRTKFKIMNDSVLVSARKYESNSYFQVQRANLAAFLMFYFGVSPHKIKEMYQRRLTF